MGAFATYLEHIGTNDEDISHCWFPDRTTNQAFSFPRVPGYFIRFIQFFWYFPSEARSRHPTAFHSHLGWIHSKSGSIQVLTLRPLSVYHKTPALAFIPRFSSLKQDLLLRRKPPRASLLNRGFLARGVNEVRSSSLRSGAIAQKLFLRRGFKPRLKNVSLLKARF